MNGGTTLAVEARGALDFGDDRIMMPIRARAEWSSSLAMEIRFIIGASPSVPHHEIYEEIRVSLTRELVNAALLDPGAPFGRGDYTIESGFRRRRCAKHIFPSHACMPDELALKTLFKGRVRTFFLDAEPISHLLIRSFVVTPANQEAVDVDTAVTKILEDAR